MVRMLSPSCHVTEGMQPKHPTLPAFGRASTLSLGSIAFGSLIVTILEMLRLLLQSVRQNANADGQPIEAILACCAECFIGCIENLVQYFNRYAYIEIALYGKVSGVCGGATCPLSFLAVYTGR